MMKSKFLLYVCMSLYCITALLQTSNAEDASVRKLNNSESSSVSVDSLDALVGRWMQLRTAISDEKRQWQNRKTQLETEIQLLETEKKKLSDEIKEFDQSASEIEKDKADKLSTKSSLQSIKESLNTFFYSVESELKRWQDVIPVSINQNIAKSFTALPASPEQAEALSLTDRALSIIALYTQIEMMQHRFHITQEMLDTGDNNRRLVDVLYFGLARGFAVSTDNKWAAIGTPSLEGWKWTTTKEYADNIREAVLIVNKQQTARLIMLPLQIMDNESSTTTSQTN